MSASFSMLHEGYETGRAKNEAVVQRPSRIAEAVFGKIEMSHIV